MSFKSPNNYKTGDLTIVPPTFTFNPDGIPDELRRTFRWVTWALVEERPGDKPVKKPVRVTSSNRVVTWAWMKDTKYYSFEEALHSYNCNKTVLGGIGYVLSKDDPYVFVDFDNLVEHDVRLDYISDVTTWMEHSQSGRGIHAIVRGVIDKSYNVNGIELYSSGRFIAMTGHIIGDVLKIADGQDMLNKLVAICKDNDTGSGIGRHDKTGRYTLPERIEQGNRNDTMFRYIGSMIFLGFDKETIINESFKANDERFDPPLDPDEVLSMIERQYSKRSENDENLYNYIRRNYIFIAEEGRWYDIEHDSVISSDSFDRLHISDGFSGGKGVKPKASAWLSKQPQMIKADGIGWIPWRYGKQHDNIIYTEGTTGGKRYVNRFKGYSCEPRDGGKEGVREWMDLLKHLVPENDYRKNVLDWFAYCIQYPDKKCNWQLVIAGIEGAGKDALLIPFSRIFGTAFKSGGNNDIKSDYDDVLGGTKFLVFNEARMITGDALEKLKRISASESTSDFVANIKGKTKVHMKNLWSVVICTNHLDAIKLSSNERRFYILKACRRLADVSSDACEKYFSWLERGGPSWLFSYLLDHDLHLGEDGGFNPYLLPGRTIHFNEMFDNTRSDLDLHFDRFMEQWDFDFIEPSYIHSYMRGRGVICTEASIKMKLDETKFKQYDTCYKIQRLNYKPKSRSWRYREGCKYDPYIYSRISWTEVWDSIDKIESFMLSGQSGSKF